MTGLFFRLVVSNKLGLKLFAGFEFVYLFIFLVDHTSTCSSGSVGPSFVPLMRPGQDHT